MSPMEHRNESALARIECMYDGMANNGVFNSTGEPFLLLYNPPGGR